MRTVQRPRLQPVKQMKDSGKEFFVAKKNVINYLMGINVKKKKVMYHSVGYSGDELAIIHRN